MKINRKALYALALPIAALYTSCSEDVTAPGYIASEGEEVTFTINRLNTRTKYEDNWDATSTQQLYWGNYLENQADTIKIFCYQGVRKVASYAVQAASTDSPDAQGISKTGAYGIQWGDASVAHNFYAFYPAKYAGDDFLTENSIRATIDAGQSPVAYRGVYGTTTMNDLSSVNANSTANASNKTVIYGEPDMSSAIMMASTPVSVEEYGQPVGLTFEVLADVLDISVNGPVTPNELGGNVSSGASDTKPYIQIQNVRLVSKSQTPICGKFDLDLTTGKASNVSGDHTIQLQTAQVINGKTYYPTLFARDNSSSNIDRLRLRAFLIPGQVTDLSDLQLVISTDCGEYTQELNSQTMESGKIHKISLKYFNQRGTQFNYANWIEQLDPNIYVNELSLPGTWHSSVEAYQGSGNNTLNTQYNAGIRAFEVHASNASTYTDPVWGTAVNKGTSDPNVTDNRASASITHNNDGTCSRVVTFTRTTITTSEADIESYNIALLNKDNGNNLTSSLTSLKGLINQKEFVVVEFGMDGQTAVTVPKTKTITETKTATATVTQNGTYSGSSSRPTYTWEDLQEPASTAYGNEKVTSSESESTDNLKSAEAWMKAVSSCLSQLASSGVIYNQEITANTTIADVAGKIIIKVNTNDESNESGWAADTPALFSRWTSGSNTAPKTVKLNWGGPATSSSTMNWCFTELDNIGSSLNGRKQAVDKMNDESIAAYKLGQHNTWYECAIGGYLNGSITARNCQAVATEMNPYLLSIMSNPNRQPCPLGLVLMNYALDETYSGPELIRAVINNNSAFILNRKSN